MGGCEKSKSPQTQISPGCGTEYEEQTAEINLKSTDVGSGELPTKTVKPVTQVENAMESETGNSLEINYEKAATEAINKVKQEMATK